MKSIIKLTFWPTFLLAAVMFTGCTKGPDSYLQLQSELYTFDASGGENLLIFSTDSPWSVETEPLTTTGSAFAAQRKAWYSITPSSGPAGENLRLQVTVGENDTYSERGVFLVLRAGTREERIAVRQRQKNAILSGQNDYAVSCEEQTLTVEVQANVAYETVVESGQQWIKEAEAPTDTKALETTAHAFRIAANTEERERKGVVLFRNTETKLCDTLTIVQAAWTDPTPELTALTALYESTGGDLYLPRAPKAEIFARIESDLTEAERYVTDNSDKAVATPAAVQMLKADYALWMYRVAGGGSSYLTMAEKAIEALNLSASRLESDYAQVFSSANKLNKEVIFAVHQANGEAVNGPGYYLGWNSNYVEAAYQNNPVPITGGNQWWWYTDRYKALLTSVEGDTRTKLTYNRADYGTTIKSIEWTEKGVGQMISGARIFDSDFILYRYAEAFLMDAEIKYYRKDYGGALTALGEITKRAYGNAAHYTDQSDAAVKRAIVEESLKELVGEGRTWWTLIRLDAVWDYNKDVADKRESNANILLWPITQESIIKNSKLKQTEGWY